MIQVILDSSEGQITQTRHILCGNPTRVVADEDEPDYWPNTDFVRYSDASGVEAGSLVLPESVLDELRLVAESVVVKFPGWSEGAATWFVLTGSSQVIYPIRVNTTVIPAIDYTQGLVTWNVEPWASGQSVLKAYRRAQKDIIGGQQRELSGRLSGRPQVWAKRDENVRRGWHVGVLEVSESDGVLFGLLHRSVHRDAPVGTAGFAMVRSRLRTRIYISINRSLHHLADKNFVFQPPKTTKSLRQVPLFPSTSIILKQHRDRQRAERLLMDHPVTDNDLVFCVFRKVDGSPLLPHSLSQAWGRLARQAGFQGIRLHDGRHSHVTSMVEQGVNRKIISERLGHGSVAMTLDLYAHASPGLQKAAAQGFDRVFDKATVADNISAD